MIDKLLNLLVKCKFGLALLLLCLMGPSVYADNTCVTLLSPQYISQLKPNLLTPPKMSPDASRLLLTDGNIIKVMDLGSKEVIQSIDAGEAVVSAHYSADASMIIALSEAGTVQLLKEDGEVLSKFEASNQKVTEVAYDQVNQKLYALTDKNTEIIWDANSGEVLEKRDGVESLAQRQIEASWSQAATSVRSILNQVRGSDAFIHGILTGMIAQEFVWLNGDPGGAKTLMARLMFKSALRSIPEQNKKIFLLQFHKLLQEGYITGFPKIKSLLESGRYEINTETSLVGDKYLFLIADEVEKANPATLSALLGVLNERKAFLGSRVVNAALSSGVFTSNKTMPEFLESFGDDLPTGEALADRMTIKLNVPSQTATLEEGVILYRTIEDINENGVPSNLSLPISVIQSLMKEVELSPELYYDLADLATNFDSLVTAERDKVDQALRNGQETSPYFPANQFSNRSMIKLLGLLKAAYIADQLTKGVPISKVSKVIPRESLHLISQAFSYGSKSRIRPKRIDIKVQGSDLGVGDDEMPAQWDPYNRLLYITGPISNGRLIVSIDKDAESFNTVFNFSQDGRTASDLELNTETLLKIIADAEKESEVDLSQIEYELENDLDQILSKRTLTVRTREELTRIQTENQQLLGLLNAQLAKDPRKVKKQVEREKALARATEIANSHKANLRALRNSPDEYKDELLRSTKSAYDELVLKFPELEHYIKSLFTSLAARSHAYVFGPPGGAKTLMARLVIDAELDSVNKQDRIDFTRKFISELASKDKFALKALLEEFRKRDIRSFQTFFLQFHKLLPEGVIVGVPKLQSQIDDGKIEYNLEDSLAAKKFLYAILDEVDKANPSVLTALLGVLNEREVFAGSEVFKAGLKSAVLTSNKMPAELFEAFADDRPSAEALYDRAINKVFVSNKFASVDRIAELIYDIDNGLKPSLEAPLSLNAVSELAKEIQIPDMILTALKMIHEQYMELRMAELERTENAYRADAISNPHYYIPAASPSNRTWIALLDQFKARVALEQVLAGVPREHLRKEAEITDIIHFFQGMGYWAPSEMKTDYTEDGLVKFDISTDELESYIASPNFSSRQKAHIRFIVNEHADFNTVINQVMQDFIVKFRETIARFPHLFPKLFVSDEAREAWVAEYEKKEAERQKAIDAAKEKDSSQEGDQ